MIGLKPQAPNVFYREGSAVFTRNQKKQIENSVLKKPTAAFEQDLQSCRLLKTQLVLISVKS